MLDVANWFLKFWNSGVTITMGQKGSNIKENDVSICIHIYAKIFKKMVDPFEESSGTA